MFKSIKKNRNRQKMLKKVYEALQGRMDGYVNIDELGKQLSFDPQTTKDTFEYLEQKNLLVCSGSEGCVGLTPFGIDEIEKSSKIVNRWWFKYVVILLISPLIVGIMLIIIKHYLFEHEQQQIPKNIITNSEKQKGAIERKAKTEKQVKRKKEIKIQIKRAIEDTNEFLDVAPKKTTKQRKLISDDFNRMNILRSSAHVKTQIEAVKGIEKEVKNAMKNLDRKIEDSLLLSNKDKEDFKTIPWLNQEYEGYVKVKEKSGQTIKNIKNETKDFLLNLQLYNTQIYLYMNEKLK